MGKSGRRKKGGGANSTTATPGNPPHSTTTTTTTTSSTSTSTISPSISPPPLPNGSLEPSVFLRRAHELKEEGNRRFQSRDYAGALEHYDLALKLTPRSHPDRAVFHSNRAACLMQMRPINPQAVVDECSLALQVQPGFPRALLRRARALEALGKLDLALTDVQSLLVSDPGNRDALDISRRLKAALGHRNGALGGQQQDLSSRPSPAALGASAVGAPIAGLGPCLPSRSVLKKSSSPPPPGRTERTPTTISDSQHVMPNGPELPKPQPKAVVLKPFKSTTPAASSSPASSSSETSNSVHPDSTQPCPIVVSKCSSDNVSLVTKWRPLKLVYDHDIRLAQMPVNCSFRVLREIVSQRFPSSKSVLIKYKDMDGDLVTITCTAELRLAESGIDQVAKKDEKDSNEEEKSDRIQVLRLHIVEVNPEQEPALPEEDQEKPLEDDALIKGDESIPNSSIGESALESVDTEISKSSLEAEVSKGKSGVHSECDHADCKEVEIDDWLFEFAQLFRTHVGIDPEAHLDLHELGMELCSEALEETVTSEEAQSLFGMAAAKFQEVAALAFFNWGNVHMCAARKRIPLDESAPKDVMTTQLQSAYDWVKERYALAGQKYEESLRIKPDFYEGLLALGQQHFETAKLQWSFALANKVDLSSWDSIETIGLFDSAEEKMKVATDIWEKLEEQRANELKDPAASKRDELLKRRKKQGVSSDGQPPSNTLATEVSAEEAAEQAAAMRSQIHLFWGNMLFERSQVEFKLGISGWKTNLDAAVERFKLAGASEADISVVIKNHFSNEEGVRVDEKKEISLSEVVETCTKDEDKHVVES